MIVVRFRICGMVTNSVGTSGLTITSVGTVMMVVFMVLQLPDAHGDDAMLGSPASATINRARIR